MAEAPLVSPPRPRRIGRLARVEIAVFAALALLPLLVAEHMTVTPTRILLLGLLALSFDLAWGYGGVMSFGQALVFGAAGYATGLLARETGTGSALIVLPLAVLAGAALAAAIGALILLARRRPAMIVVALGTLAGAFIAERLMRGWYWAGGQNGVAGLPYLRLFGREIAEGPGFYYLAPGCAALVYGLSRRLVRSQFGLSLAAARSWAKT